MQTILKPFESKKQLECSKRYKHIYKNQIKNCTPFFVFADSNGEYIEHDKDYYIEAKKALEQFEAELNKILVSLESN